MNPYLEGGLGLLGTGMQAYGTYQQGQQAQKQYELAVRAWQAEQDRQQRMDEDNRQQQLLSNVMAGGTYAQGLTKNAQDAYGTYARQVGY